MTTEPFIDLVAKVALVGCVIMIYLLIRHILINPFSLYLFRLLRPLKENPVPGFKPEQLVNQSLRVLWGHEKAIANPNDVVSHTEDCASRGDEERSVNDYTQQRERAQQFTILANKLVQMGTKPWSIVAPVTLSLAPLAHMANAVVAISTPAADAANTGNAYIVSIGQARIPCETSDEMRDITIALNADTAQVLLPHRLALLKWFSNYGTVLYQDLKPWTTVRSGSAEAAVPADVDAEKLCKDLNDVYERHTAPIRTRLRVLLAQLAEAEAAVCEKAIGNSK